MPLSIGHSFDRIKVHPETRNTRGSNSPNEVLTQNPPGPLPVPAPAQQPQPGHSCKVLSGPSYTPTGTIPVTPEGKEKRALFHFSASFANTPANPARCCEVRQYIMWDQAFRDWNKGPPHNRFEQDTPEIFHEDRNNRDGSRYGHRTGKYSRPTAGCKDEYKTGGVQDTLKGDTYCGEDSPLAPAGATGQFQFCLGLDDMCGASPGREVASSDPIIVEW